jgi:hypothetical protein
VEVVGQITYDAEPLPLLRAGAAPNYAGGGRTPAGLPYPVTSDYLSQTDRYIADLADATKLLLASPGLVVGFGPVTTASDGRVWMTFAKLAAVAGVVVQVYTGGWQIMPRVIQRIGNQALIHFPYVPFNVQDSVPKNFVGTLSAITYAWGTPS